MTVSLPKCLQPLYEGINTQTYPEKDFPKPPPWLDPLLLTRGQNFAKEHFYALAYCDILSLIFLFSFKDSLDPLIFTGNSSCVFSAFNRYVSTASRVVSWYESDIFDPTSKAGKNLASVRQMHRHVIDRLKNAQAKEFAERTKIERPMARIAPFLKKDLDQMKGLDKQAHSVGTLPLNQWHSGITQFAFIGMAVMYPEKLGIGSHTEADLEALVHLWAVLGYMIGIEDKYNWCIDGLQKFRERGLALRRSCILPNLRNGDASWEHMSRCMGRGTGLYMPSVTFESLLLYLMFVLNAPMNNLWAVISWRHKILYCISKIMLTIVIYLPGAKEFFNHLTRMGLKVAQNANPDWLQRAKEKAMIYEENFKRVKHD
ncbi:uncharacterized protein LOC132195467 [Neocloeon triangulifer]|uniref:uncharacterized protein LOC132195467 n=1 Tax=Neocloeon triangulifer TaxID=2078957 RepID=UPI00286F5D93|nr:uncharacterized protein LOC132195467 [Neocloeon triangulifer]